MNQERMSQIIMEELSKTDIKSAIDDKLSSKDFEKKVKEIVTNSINQLFKTLYQHNNLWSSSIKR